MFTSTTTVTDAVTAVKTVYTKFGLPLPTLNPMTEGTLVRYDHIPSKLNIYYFHPDHLGSAAYITNAAGTVSQHMEYLPFGETLVDEHTNSFNSPFKFNGKEFDEETGNYYYSARYYNPKWSIFISVDPLAEQTMDAYGYCYQNPINLIDPTGMEADGWVTTINDNGTKTHTFDPNINNCAEAEAAGYTNVEGVYESVNVSAKDGSYSYNLNADGTVTNALWGDVPVTMGNIYGTDYNFARTEGGTDILTNRIAIDTRPQGGQITQMDFSSPFFPWGAVFNSVGKAATTADGFLFGSIKVNSPININVQRFGNMSTSRPDYWGLRLGSNKFVNRTFVAIKPEWNSLTQYSTGVIPKGTPINVGIIAPQGWRYPGGSLQFLVNSNSVINQSTTIIP